MEESEICTEIKTAFEERTGLEEMEMKDFNLFYI